MHLFQPAALPESVQSLTERERKPGWAARRKPQTGLTVRLRPGEAFARSKNAESVLFAPTDGLWTGPQEGAHAA